MTENLFELDHMTWPEVEEALKTIKVALLPIGSCEQHGPHLELRTDAVRAYEIARRLTSQLHPETIICPTINYGQSQHHLGFPGTLSLKPRTLMAVVEDILTSLLHHGIRKFLIINGHGGNNPLLQVVASEFKMHNDVEIAISGITPIVADICNKSTGSRFTGHACEVEVSQAMILAPSIVRLNCLEAGKFNQQPLIYTSSKYPARISMPYRFDEMTANGALGDATQWSEEFGQVMVDTVLERIAEFLRELIDKPVR